MLPVDLQKKKKSRCLRVGEAAAEHTPVSFLYRNSRLSSIASACATQWKMWPVKIFSTLCKFLDLLAVQKTYTIDVEGWINVNVHLISDLTDLTAVCAVLDHSEGKIIIKKKDKVNYLCLLYSLTSLFRLYLALFHHNHKSPLWSSSLPPSHISIFTFSSLKLI